MINIYGNFADDEPAETHERGHAVTVLDWLQTHIDGFVDDGRIAVMLNGRPLARMETSIDDTDVVDIHPIPKYTAIYAAGAWIASYWTYIAAALTIASTAYSLLNKPSLPSGPEASPTGADSNSPNAKANTAKMGGIVREAFGKTKIYPDYLVPPHRFFRNKRDQELDLAMAIGNGEYDIKDVKVGRTELADLGDDAEVKIYSANDDVSGDDAFRWWQPCKEVGVSSNGQQGLPLNPPHVYDQIDFDQFTWDGHQIKTTGSDEWPTNWDGTLILKIRRRRVYAISNHNGKAIITGDFSDALPLASGDQVMVDDHPYEVDSYSSTGSGSPAIVLGSNAPKTSYQGDTEYLHILLDGKRDDILFNGNYTNAAGVVSHINANMHNVNATASIENGKVKITENAPYSGDTFRINSGSGPLGPFPDFTPGSKHTSDSELTLTKPIYSEGGQAEIAITKYDGQFVVTAVSASTLTVDRIKEDESIDTNWAGFNSSGPAEASISAVGTTKEATWIGPFRATPEGEKTDTLETDFFFPQGLTKYDDHGELESTPQTVQLEWRKIGDTGWTREQWDYREATPDQIGFTEIVNLGGKKEVEVRARATGYRSDSQHRRDVVWFGLKSKMIPPDSYPWQTLSVKLKTAHNIARQSENQINLIATRKIPVVTSTGYGATQPTRSIAACVGEICKQIGYRESDIDFPSLATLDDFWQPRDDYFDYAFPQTTVADAINTALRAGMATMTMDDGKLTAVRDGRRTVFEQGFSAQNMTGPLQRNYTSRTASDPDGVDVKFVNQDNDYTNETIKIRLPGDQGIKAETVTLHGVLDYTHAWRIGMRRRMEQKYRRWVYKWSTEMEGLNLHYLSFIPLVIYEPEYGQSAIVENIQHDGSHYIVQSSEPLDWSGSNHVVAFRKRDGSLAGPYAATAYGEYGVRISEKPPEYHDQGEPIHLYFGQQDTWQQPCLVQSMTPTGDDFDVEAVNYDERIYQYDDEVPA